MAYERFGRATRQHRTALLATSTLPILLSIGLIQVDGSFIPNTKLVEPLSVKNLIFGLSVWWFVSFYLAAQADRSVEPTGTPISLCTDKIVKFYDALREKGFDEGLRSLGAGGVISTQNYKMLFNQDPELLRRLSEGFEGLDETERSNLSTWLENCFQLQTTLAEIELPTTDDFGEKSKFERQILWHDRHEFYLPISIFFVNSTLFTDFHKVITTWRSLWS